jgi:hypothetical protein
MNYDFREMFFPDEVQAALSIADIERLDVELGRLHRAMGKFPEGYEYLAKWEAEYAHQFLDANEISRTEFARCFTFLAGCFINHQSDIPPEASPVEADYDHRDVDDVNTKEDWESTYTSGKDEGLLDVVYSTPVVELTNYEQKATTIINGIVRIINQTEQNDDQ